MKNTDSKTKSAFEDDLRRLDEIISEIESADTPLADSLALYKEGMELASDCAKELAEIENQVLILTKDAAGVLKTQAFATEEQDDDEF